MELDYLDRIKGVRKAERKDRNAPGRLRWSMETQAAIEQRKRQIEFLKTYEHPVKKIARQVAERHRLHIDDVLGKRRFPWLVKARNEVYYLGLQNYSSTQVGNAMGKCHTTVLHGASSHAQENNLPPVTLLDAKAKRESCRTRYASSASQ